MIEIYCGDGKGKTTAGVGLAVRAAGHGFCVLFLQFMKDGSSGEIAVLKSISQIQVMHAHKFYGFTKNMNDEQKLEMRACYTKLLDRARKEMLQAGQCRILIVLDEVIHACNHQLLDEKLLCEFLDECPSTAEVVLTGRDPSPELLQRADYISKIEKVKHPYDLGVPARKGIEL